MIATVKVPLLERKRTLVPSVQMISLTNSTAQILRQYLRDMQGTHSEIGKRERFSALLGSLYSNTREVSLYSQGAETSLRIQMPGREKRGSADTVYGSAVVEFEKNLKHTLKEAERQLREYVAGIWQGAPAAPRFLDAVATDGIIWRIYRPVLSHGAPVLPENISLELRREVQLGEDTLGDFYRWLDLFLFRGVNIEPSSENVQYDFGSASNLFGAGRSALRQAWTQGRRHPEALLAYETWCKYLTITYGKLSESTQAERDAETGEELSESEELFLRHTWLVSIARLMVWAALSGGKTDQPLRFVAASVFSGEFFQAKNLANLADKDFFHWIAGPDVEPILAPAWERVLDTLLTYNLSRMREDVLKGVYQQLIDPKDRHDLGEYYTPDWLCERIAAEMLPAEGYSSVLDPSCGSGSFLRAAIHHFVDNNPEQPPRERLTSVLANVKGIDIHPVAVTIARANYVLALGPLVSAARRPVQIPVYLADALFLPREVERKLFEQISGLEITFGPRRDERVFTLPEVMLGKADLFDDAIAGSTRVAEEHASTGRETRERLDTYLRRAVPAMEQLIQREQVVDALWRFTSDLSELIRDKQNSIWSFVIRNSYRPALLRYQFDVILGNPPWVAYRYVTDPEYQKEIKKRAVETYKIAPKSQKLFTQMELATVFLAHAMHSFAKPGGKLAFVMPRSVLSADQHQNLIQRKYSADFKLTGYWDLRGVTPLFNVPSCVLFAEQTKRIGVASDPMPAQIWTGRLPSRDAPWAQVAERFTVVEKQAGVIWLGGRSALSTETGAAGESRSSVYADLFRNGATIYPRNFYFVTVDGLEGTPDPERLYPCRTDEESARESKAPYRELRMRGSVEGRFLFSTALSRHVLPFVLLPPTPVVLPLEEVNGRYYTLTAQALQRKGFRDAAGWMERVDALWLAHRGGKVGQTATEWLDYSGKLTAQSPAHRHLVLYNAAGTNVSATYCDRQALPMRFVVDHVLYWAVFDQPEEAHYLTAILNTESVNEAIKPFQSMGLLGQRHVHKKLLEVPFPRYESTDPVHARLAAIGVLAHTRAQEAVDGAPMKRNANLARKRAYVRTACADLLNEADALVRTLLNLA